MYVTIQYKDVNRQFEEYSELSDFINYDQDGNDDEKADKIKIISISDDLPELSDITELIEVWEFLDDLDEQEREIALERYNDIGCDISDWDDDYLGVYDSWQDYIEQYVGECVLSELPERYQYYFDTESFGRDVRYEGFHSIYELNSGDVAIYHN